MAGLLDKIFGGRSRALALARSAELRGDLARAIDLFERAERFDEAGRVRKARALGVLALATSAPVIASARPELALAAEDLEGLGEFLRAAEAYALAQDLEGETRALVRAGEIERLDDLLEADQARSQQDRARRRGHDEFELLVASGRRREACELARASSDEALRARGRAVEAKRVTAPVRAVLGGDVKRLVLGDRVVLGRAPDAGEPRVGVVAVASAALSRRHLSIARRDGDVWVRDLGSHHGTTLRGEPLRGEAAVGAGIELRLGGEVRLVLRPADDLPGAMALEIAGVRYLAAIGPADLGIGRWRLECVPAAGVGDWIELVTDDAPPAFAGGIRLAARVSLLEGDALATTATASIRSTPSTAAASIPSTTATARAGDADAVIRFEG